MIFAVACMIAASTAYEGYINYKLRSAIDDSFFKSSQFPRDYWLNSARNQAEKNPEESEKKVLYHLQLNPYDAFGWNFLGHLQQRQKHLDEAHNSFLKAVQNNPANFFAFYGDWLKAANILGKSSPENAMLKEKAVQFLQNYPEKVRLNVHYTAQSSNPDYAIELAQILGKTELAKKIREAQKVVHNSK